MLATGAYFTPAILLRSGIGPEQELNALGIRLLAKLPVGERLLDHCVRGIAWEPTERLHAETAAHEEHGPLFEAHVVVKAASRRCTPGSWDIHLLPFTNRGPAAGRYEVSCGVFNLDMQSTGRLRLRSADPNHLPLVERGFLADLEDLPVIVEALELPGEPRASRRPPGCRTAPSARRRALRARRPRCSHAGCRPAGDTRRRRRRRRSARRGRLLRPALVAHRAPLATADVIEGRGPLHAPTLASSRVGTSAGGLVRRRYDRRVTNPAAIHFTGNGEADELLAREPLRAAHRICAGPAGVRSSRRSRDRSRSSSGWGD